MRANAVSERIQRERARGGDVTTMTEALSLATPRSAAFFAEKYAGGAAIRACGGETILSPTY